VSEALYTTQLQAGLGLTVETARLLELWEPGMSRQALLAVALDSGAFPNMSARRLRNVVTEAFAPRYLRDDGEPARILKALSGRIPPAELRQLLFLYTCRANPILADFVRDVYWARYAAGGTGVAKEDAQSFVRRAVARGRTRKIWSESTIIRVSNYLLGTCADYGLLGPLRTSARGIIPFRILPGTVSVLAHDLHFRGLGDNAILLHEDWGLFGLEKDDVLQELRRLALRGEIILQSAAAVTHIGWKYKTMEDLGDGLVAC